MAMLYLRNKPIGAISSGASGGGHTIIDPSGESLTQQPNLKFKDAQVINDAGNEATVVQMIRDMDSEDFEDAAEQGMYFVNDEEDYAISGDMVAYNANKSVNDVLDELIAESESVSVTADGTKTYAQLITELDALVNRSKLNYSSYIVINGSVYQAGVIGNELRFSMATNHASNRSYISTVMLHTHTYLWWDCTNGTITAGDTSSLVPSSGLKIELYYNSSQKVVESGGVADTISYNPTIKNILPSSANKVQSAIDALSTAVTTTGGFGNSLVRGNGVKTYSQLLDELYAIADWTKLNANTSAITIGGQYWFRLSYSATNRYVFSYSMETGVSTIGSIDIKPSGSSYKYSSISSTISHTDASSTVVPNSTAIALYY